MSFIFCFNGSIKDTARGSTKMNKKLEQCVKFHPSSRYLVLQIKNVIYELLMQIIKCECVYITKKVHKVIFNAKSTISSIIKRRSQNNIYLLKFYQREDVYVPIMNYNTKVSNCASKLVKSNIKLIQTVQAYLGLNFRKFANPTNLLKSQSVSFMTIFNV